MTKISFRWVAVLPVVLACTACSKSDSSAPSGPTSASVKQGVAAAPSGSSPIAAASGPVGSAAAGSAGAPSSRTSWSGSYTAEVGSQETAAAAKELKDAKGADDSARTALGPGTMELAIEGARVHGEAKGALGAFAVSGVFEDREVRAQALPTDPNANDAMTGWMLLRAEGEPAAPSSLVGTLRVSGRDARLVREASVRLTPRK